MSGRGKKAAAPKKKANGYKMPAPIPAGEVIHDTIGKKKWRIGPSIGVGGFGEIYSACDHEGSPKKTSSYPFVVKIEPHENGPLFVEKHFYIRNANKDDIATFMKSKKLSSLGMPLYFGNGSHDFQGEKYRYLVLERYGTDVWKLFLEAGRSFPVATVFQLGLQMLDVLEYIHSRGYVHADLKGANILMGLRRGTEQQAYLVDFGLATRVSTKEFKPDPKCAHNGTIEYTSRDAHLGVSTMRGDLEILGYNMLQWLIGTLPWEKSLTQPATVQNMKEDFMKNVRATVTKKYPQVPDQLIKFFEYINTLKPNDLPNYTKCRQLFEACLKSEGKTRGSKLVFSHTTNKKTDTTDSADKDVKPKRAVRRAKEALTQSNNENNPNNTEKVAKIKNKKRKSNEPVSDSTEDVKKTKLTKKTPVKKALADMATQTSLEKTRRSPRQVSFDSPICEIIGEKKSINSSGDIFDDSFVIEEKKVKPKRKLLSAEEVTVKRVVRKKTTVNKGTVNKGTVNKGTVNKGVVKGKSWKDSPAVLNGRSPPK